MAEYNVIVKKSPNIRIEYIMDGRPVNLQDITNVKAMYLCEQIGKANMEIVENHGLEKLTATFEVKDKKIKT